MLLHSIVCLYFFSFPWLSKSLPSFQWVTVNIYTTSFSVKRIFIFFWFFSLFFVFFYFFLFFFLFICLLKEAVIYGETRGFDKLNHHTFFILFFDMNEFWIFSGEYRFRNKFGMTGYLCYRFWDELRMTSCSVYSGFDGLNHRDNERTVEPRSSGAQAEECAWAKGGRVEFVCNEFFAGEINLTEKKSACKKKRLAFTKRTKLLGHTSHSLRLSCWKWFTCIFSLRYENTGPSKILT